MEKNENNIKKESAFQGFKIAFNAAINGLDNEKIQKCLSLNENISYKLWECLSNCKSDNDILILNSYLEQGIKLIDDIMKRGEKDNG